MTKDREISNLPSPASGSLSLYLSQIKKFQCWTQKRSICLQKIGKKEVI